MSETVKTVLSSALALSEAERLEIAEQLLESLPPAEAELSEEEFAAELDRRREEAQRDPSAVITWDELKRQV